MLREYLEELLTFERVEEVWPLHLEAMKIFVFERALFVFARHRTSLNQYDRD
mgnify:CR=1 FL=1